MKENNLKINKETSNNSGLTIIEFLIYFAITVIVLSIIVNISINVFVGKEKIEAHQEVVRNGRYAIDEIIDVFSEAEEVIGTSDGS
jgi:Tfp pilus assembly protein PilW